MWFALLILRTWVLEFKFYCDYVNSVLSFCIGSKILSPGWKGLGPIFLDDTWSFQSDVSSILVLRKSSLALDGSFLFLQLFVSPISFIAVSFSSTGTSSQDCFLRTTQMAWIIPGKNPNKVNKMLIVNRSRREKGCSSLSDEAVSSKERAIQNINYFSPGGDDLKNSTLDVTFRWGGGGL